MKLVPRVRICSIALEPIHSHSCDYLGKLLNVISRDFYLSSDTAWCLSWMTSYRTEYMLREWNKRIRAAQFELNVFWNPDPNITKALVRQTHWEKSFYSSLVFFKVFVYCTEFSVAYVHLHQSCNAKVRLEGVVSFRWRLWGSKLSGTTP